jgi:uncharacterized repeat protein (TIGR03803 family)
MDGANPSAGLIRDASGNLYGTTVSGGTSVLGSGTVFKLDTDGVESVLYSFSGGADGGTPQAGLVRDAAGNLYGTTSFGGDLNCNSTLGCGTVFKLDTHLEETVLHAFTGANDGALLFESLVLHGDNLYGTAAINGASGYGTVFKLTKSGRLNVLHSFNNLDGAFPQAALLRDREGTLYGTTASGGNLNCNCGTVFKLTP